ncbi:hypothetical protein F4780DRAFT_750464 [Xylariomycetidae sp. FL0641]|nr:hypothetical protein F4780DRAFT_750464 [Xylariomycetidae sp. FL0641]
MSLHVLRTPRLSLASSSSSPQFSQSCAKFHPYLPPFISILGRRRPRPSNFVGPRFSDSPAHPGPWSVRELGQTLPGLRSELVPCRPSQAISVVDTTSHDDPCLHLVSYGVGPVPARWGWTGKTGAELHCRVGLGRGVRGYIIYLRCELSTESCCWFFCLRPLTVSPTFVSVRLASRPIPHSFPSLYSPPNISVLTVVILSGYIASLTCKTGLPFAPNEPSTRYHLPNACRDTTTLRDLRTDTLLTSPTL